MLRSFRLPRAALGVAILLLTCLPAPIVSQVPAPPDPRRDSVDIVAGARYGAGGFRRFLLGSGYRDRWTTSIRVEVLDLRTFAGGLRPLKLSGGNQTQSLRLEAPNGIQFVFRSVDKTGTSTPAGFRHTVVNGVIRDQVSTSDPAAGMVAAELLEAAGVLHVTPVLVVMPDDSLLGEFRKEFAGKLGMIEESPGTPGHDPGFAGAVAIIDSDTLLSLLNRDPRERIDAPAMVAARLMDMLLGDWDRHPGQWRWARMQSSPRSDWLPIPRDRDKAFISAGGVVIGVARLGHPNLMAFDGSYASAKGLTWNSLEFDRRLLGGVARPVWDSVTVVLMQRITDAVIDDAVQAVPVKYLPSAPEIARKLKLRRDALPGAADRFYRLIAAVADIHATDAADRATVTRAGDGLVEVRLESGDGRPYFLRQFDALETSEIRIYLHGGADTALVMGKVQSSILVRIIGGNGANRLIDSSEVNGSPDRAHLYDVGTMGGVGYGPDTVFNRQPWVMEQGELVRPGPNRGARLGPVFGLKTNRELGFVPHVGLYRTRYGFGRRPYASSVGLDAEYSTGIGEFRVGISADRRFEGTPVHLLANARVSRLEVISFYGLGNATAGPAPEAPATAFFEVRQRQWVVQPAVAVSLGPRSDISLGPVFQVSITDSTPNRYISTVQPYGYGSFGQAGVRLSLRHDARDQPADPHRGLLLDFTGSLFPAVWDVKSAFGALRGNAKMYVVLPIPVHPILVVGGGATKVLGVYPFHEAAFIGGPGSLQSMDAQRYAGDASVYGTTELRVPLAKFSMLLPWNVGVFGVMDAGRVYVDGASPGGWHSARGLGFWFGVLGPNTSIRFCRRPGESGPC